MRWKHFFAWVACGAATSVAPFATHATTFVLMDEHELAAASTAVVSGWVTGVEAHADPLNGGVNTYVSIEPTAILSGVLPEGEIVLRERGGQVPGRVEKIFGAPEYTIGEQVVVFLSQDADGSLHTTAMAMGKYTVQKPRGAAATVSRHLGAEVTVFDRATARLREHAAPDVADLGQFEEHVRAAHHLPRRAGSHRRPVRLIPPEIGRTVPHNYESPFTYLGNPSRWFEPDFGQPVLYQIDASGDARNGPLASRTAVDSAFAAWTGVPNSSLVLGDGGWLAAPLPFSGCAGSSRIVFNDPFDEMTDPSGCGGILAIGGYCSSAETATVNSTAFQRITLGKVVFNNGWEQCDIWNACNLAEVATHEIGHTIGLGHSNDDTATMAAVAHFDGRCAGLGSDDVTAVQFIYPAGGAPTATAVPTSQPTSTSIPAPPTATATPSNSGAALNDTCLDATTIGATPYSNSVLTTTATIDASDPVPACGNGSRGKSVWYRFKAPSAGTVTANTFGSSYDTILVAYLGSCGRLIALPNACNDDTNGRQSRVSFEATAGTTYYLVITAYSNNGGSLALQLAAQGAPGTATPTATFTPRPPTPTSTTGPAPTATFTRVLPTATFTSAPQPPPTAPTPSALTNDSAATPLDVISLPFSFRQSTVSTTLDPSDPVPACGNRSRGRSVWYRFTPSSTGTLSADTFGSNYDTILAAFARSGGAYTAVGCNDDSGGAQSRISFQATAGTVYYFMITAYSNNGGTLVFHLSFQGTPGAPPTATPSFTARPTWSPTPTVTAGGQPPAPPSNIGLPNDTCAGATDIGATPYSANSLTSSATAESNAPAPACGNQSRGKGVWYRFTAATEGTITAQTFGSNYDTILAAYSGSCTTLRPVACNDDSVGVQSRVAFQALAGSTYHFLVTAYHNDGGSLVFQLN